MASEKSSLIEHNYSTNSTALSAANEGESDLSVIVNNPFTAGSGSDPRDNRNGELDATHHQSLTSGDPREILFALERAADLLRGQVEESDQQHRGDVRYGEIKNGVSADCFLLKEKTTIACLAN